MTQTEIILHPYSNPKQSYSYRIPMVTGGRSLGERPSSEEHMNNRMRAHIIGRANGIGVPGWWDGDFTTVEDRTTKRRTVYTTKRQKGGGVLLNFLSKSGQ